MSAKSAAADQSARCGAAWSCVSVCSLAVFVYTATTLARYTPLYRPLECMQQKSGLGPLQMDAQWINVTGGMKKSCSNPNSYPVSVTERSMGQVYVLGENNTLTPVGVSHVPDTVFPAHGEVVAESRMEIAVPSAQAAALLAAPLLRVVTEIKVLSEAELRFFGVPMRSGTNKDEICGFELRLATKKVGPSACAKTLKELVIPDVDSLPKMELVHMDKHALEAAQTKKNVAFGLILALTGIMMVFSSVLAVRQVLAGRRQVREQELKSNAAEQV